jgi:hypothetical protein
LPNAGDQTAPHGTSPLEPLRKSNRDMSDQTKTTKIKSTQQSTLTIEQPLPTQETFETF